MKPLSALDPDLVLAVDYTQHDAQPTERAKREFAVLAKQLKEYGFYSQVRPNDGEELLVFIKLNDTSLLSILKNRSVKKYLHGLETQFDSDETLLARVSRTERISAVFQALTDPASSGCAGITPGAGKWEFVRKVSPIWDHEESKALLKSLLRPGFGERDVERIRLIAGAKVALYFEFLRLYFNWLIIPSLFGLISHLFFHRFSILFTLINSLWAIVFLNNWNNRERILGIQWGLKDTDKLQEHRADFVGEYDEIDPVSGNRVPVASSLDRTARQLAFLPIAVVALLVLVSYQVACFFIEIFLTELYQGPGKPLLGLVPTVLIVGIVPILTAIYEKFVDKAVAWENHEYQSTLEKSKIQKMYLYNFLSSYVPIFITVFLYLPFGHFVNRFLPTLTSFSSKLNIPVVHDRYQINTQRLVDQFSYFIVTAQVISFLLENVVPITMRLVKENLGKKKKVATLLDSSEETEFLNNVRQQLSLPEFDVHAEYRELTMQFGYLVLFGPVWSLAPLVSLVFNWIEIRGDAEKLLFECSRPVPRRVESISPWSTHLKALSWIGSFVGPVVTLMYRQQDKVVASSAYTHLSSPVSTPGWKIFATALFSENAAIAVNIAIGALFATKGDEVEREDDNKAMQVRRSYVGSYLEKSTEQASKTSSDSEWGSNDDAIIQATALPALIARASSAKENETAEKVKETEPTVSSTNIDTAADKVVPLVSSGFNQHQDSQLRSTAASKTVPQTDPQTPIFSPTSVSAFASVPGQHNATSPDVTKESRSRLSASSSENESVAASNKAVIGVPVATPTPSLTSKSKVKGLFKFGKREPKDLQREISSGSETGSVSRKASKNAEKTSAQGSITKKSAEYSAAVAAPSLAASGAVINPTGTGPVKADGKSNHIPDSASISASTQKPLGSPRDTPFESYTPATGPSVTSAAPVDESKKVSEDLLKSPEHSGLKSAGSELPTATGSENGASANATTNSTGDTTDYNSPHAVGYGVGAAIGSLVAGAGAAVTAAGAAVGLSEDPNAKKSSYTQTNNSTGPIGTRTENTNPMKSEVKIGESEELKSELKKPGDSSVLESKEIDRQDSSTSSSRVSLAGATLPPDFERKLKSASRSSGSQKSVDAKREAKSEAPSNAGNSSSSGAGTAAAASVASVASVAGAAGAAASYGKSPHKIERPYSVVNDANDSSSGKSTEKLASKDTGSANGKDNVGEFFSEASDGAKNGKGDLVDNVKLHVGQGAAALNAQTQKAAQRIESYAGSSDNKLVQQGNEHFQSLAKEVDNHVGSSAIVSDATATNASDTGVASKIHAKADQAGSKVENSTGNSDSKADEKVLETSKKETTTGSKTEQSTAGTSAGSHAEHSSPKDDVRSTSSASSPNKKKGLLSKVKSAMKPHSAHSSAHSTPKK